MIPSLEQIGWDLAGGQAHSELQADLNYKLTSLISYLGTSESRVNYVVDYSYV